MCISNVNAMNSPKTIRIWKGKGNERNHKLAHSYNATDFPSFVTDSKLTSADTPVSSHISQSGKTHRLLQRVSGLLLAAFLRWMSNDRFVDYSESWRVLIEFVGKSPLECVFSSLLWCDGGTYTFLRTFDGDSCTEHLFLFWCSAPFLGRRRWTYLVLLLLADHFGLDLLLVHLQKMYVLGVLLVAPLEIFLYMFLLLCYCQNLFLFVLDFRQVVVGLRKGGSHWHFLKCLLQLYWVLHIWL